MRGQERVTRGRGVGGDDRGLHIYTSTQTSLFNSLTVIVTIEGFSSSSFANLTHFVYIVVIADWPAFLFLIIIMRSNWFGRLLLFQISWSTGFQLNSSSFFIVGFRVYIYFFRTISKIAIIHHHITKIISFLSLWIIIIIIVILGDSFFL